MTKGKRLKICNIALVLLSITILTSSIQLEATHSSGIVWVWLHIIIGTTFMAMIIWHLYLHFQWRSWIRKLRRQKSPVTHWLVIFGLLTLLTGIATFVHWLPTRLHSPIGAIHGKIGFLFIALAIAHTIRRISFFRK